MTADEAIQKLDFVIANLDNWIKEILITVSWNGLALVVNRIQQEGLEGKQYSNQKLPEFYFEGKDLNAGGRNLLERKDKKKMRQGIRYLGGKVRKNAAIDAESDGISYREWRQANGLQVAHVDLTYTGMMFRGLKKLEHKTDGNTHVVRIYSEHEEVNKKLRWNAQRFGDFLAFNHDEKQMLEEIFKNRLLAKFETTGFK